MITAARYNTPEHVPIIIVQDSWQETLIPSFPSGTYYDAAVQEFLDGGGQIDAYDQYYEITDESLREQKYNLKASLADSEVEAAEATPVQGPILDTRKTEKENLRRENRGKRNNKMTDADDEMADHVDSIMDVLDQADDEVENLDRTELEAWDGSTIVWPVWTPPAG